MPLNGRIETGGMPAPTVPLVTNLNAGEEFKIKNGYHSGQSVVNANSLSSQTQATATSNDIAFGKTAWVNGVLVTGLVTEQEENTKGITIARTSSTATDSYITYPAGFYTNPENWVYVGNPNISSLLQLNENTIANGKTILGVRGTYTSGATATADDIVYGYIAYANGQRLTGTLSSSMIYNISFTGYNNSIQLKWTNPSIGPFKSIRVNLTDTNGNSADWTIDVTGNTLPDQSNSYLLTHNIIKPGMTYTVRIWTAAGSLRSKDEYVGHITVNGTYATLAPNLASATLIPRDIVQFVRVYSITDAQASSATDLSKEKDKSILGWKDANNIYRYYSTADSIIAPVECAGLFENCTQLQNIDISTIDFSFCQSIYRIFKSCSSLVSLDLSTMYTSNMINMSYIFSGCTSLTSLNVSTWNTANANVMGGVFQNCGSLKTLDLASWNTNKIRTMDYMFTGCKLLTNITYGDNFKRTAMDVSKLAQESGNPTYAMFNNCPANKPSWTGGSWVSSGTFVLDPINVNGASLTAAILEAIAAAP